MEFEMQEMPVKDKRVMDIGQDRIYFTESAGHANYSDPSIWREVASEDHAAAKATHWQPLT